MTIGSTFRLLWCAPWDVWDGVGNAECANDGPVDRVALALQGREGATALPAGSGSLTRVGCLRSMSAPYSPTKSHQAGLRCGSVLDAQQLADRLNAARTPVRQALRRLAASGLVVMRPRRGVVVARMSPERITEAFETMAEIEAMCVLFATYWMTPVERGRLLEPHRSSRPLAAAGDLDAYDAFNRQLHVCLDHATHNSFRVEQAVGIRIRLNALRRTPAASSRPYASVYRAAASPTCSGAAVVRNVQPGDQFTAVGDLGRCTSESSRRAAISLCGYAAPLVLCHTTGSRAADPRRRPRS